AQLAAATKKNGEQNDVRARYLAWSGRLLLLGICASFVFLLVSIFHQPHGGNQNERRDTHPTTNTGPGSSTSGSTSSGRANQPSNSGGNSTGRLNTNGG